MKTKTDYNGKPRHLLKKQGSGVSTPCGGADTPTNNDDTPTLSTDLAAF
jgi:hypothetical protein